MWNTGLDESQAAIKVANRNTNNLRYADDTTLIAETKKELKSLLISVKEESEKAGFKFNIRRAKIMASSFITSWQIEGENVEAVSDFILRASKSQWVVSAAMKLKNTCFLEGKLLQT